MPLMLFLCSIGGILNFGNTVILSFFIIDKRIEMEYDAVGG